VKSRIPAVEDIQVVVVDMCRVVLAERAQRVVDTVSLLAGTAAAVQVVVVAGLRQIEEPRILVVEDIQMVVVDICKVLLVERVR